MPTLLHISDLHRTLKPRTSNEELIAAIIGDEKRWESEGIPTPDLIIVSGDLIQGVPTGSPCADDMIAEQYHEAGDFLRDLADELVDSELSRVIIVPGNHDVDWNRALNAMRPLKTCPSNIDSKAFDVNSKVRWDWKEQQAYEINNRKLYESRFDHFRQFQQNFYAGLNPNPLAQVNGDLVFVEYSDLGLVVVGFSSWYGNDCFCHVGEIDSSMLNASRKLLENSQMPIAIAVWHHGVVGGPCVHDYMDQGVVHKLIDFGFTIGLHGHQHYPAAAPFDMRLPNLTSMVIVGAGSLAVGDSELPMGEHRQFNIVVIDPANDEVTIHVRAMSPAGIFTASYRNDFGGNSSIKLQLPTTSRSRQSPRFRQSPTTICRLDDAMTALRRQDYNQALLLCDQIPNSRSKEKRQITLRALDGLGDEDRLIEFLDHPQNVNEIMKLISTLLDVGQFDKASERLKDSQALLDTPLFEELSTMIDIRRVAS